MSDAFPAQHAQICADHFSSLGSQGGVVITVMLTSGSGEVGLGGALTISYSEAKTGIKNEAKNGVTSEAWPYISIACYLMMVKLSVLLVKLQTHTHIHTDIYVYIYIYILYYIIIYYILFYYIILYYYHIYWYTSLKITKPDHPRLTQRTVDICRWYSWRVPYCWPFHEPHERKRPVHPNSTP